MPRQPIDDGKAANRRIEIILMPLVSELRLFQRHLSM
jgi:hypothetical protein